MNKIATLLQELDSCQQPKLAQKILAKIISQAAEQLVDYESSESGVKAAGPLGLGNLQYSAPKKKNEEGAAMVGLSAMLVVFASEASSNSFLRDQFKNQASSLVEKIQKNFGIQTGMISAKLQTVLKSSTRLAEMQQEFERVSNQVAEAASELPVLTQSLENTKIELAQFQSGNSQALLERATLTKQLDSLRQQVASLESDRKKVTDLQSKVTQYESEIPENQKQLSELESKIEILRNQQKQLAEAIKARVHVTQQLVEATKRMDDGIAKSIQRIWEQLPQDQLDLMLI